MTGQTTSPQKQEPLPSNRRYRVMIAVLVGLAILIAGTIVSLVLLNIPSTEEIVTGVCHEDVADGMKDPSSTVFESTKALIGDEDGWYVFGEGRSNNSFGAAVPFLYGCELTVDRESESGWSAETEVAEY